MKESDNRLGAAGNRSELINLSVCLSVCWSVCLSFRLYITLSICVHILSQPGWCATLEMKESYNRMGAVGDRSRWPIYLSVCLLVGLSVFLPDCISDFLRACPVSSRAMYQSEEEGVWQPAVRVRRQVRADQSICLSLCLSVCLSVYQTLSQAVYYNIWNHMKLQKGLKTRLSRSKNSYPGQFSPGKPRFRSFPTRILEPSPYPLRCYPITNTLLTWFYFDET